MAILKRRVSSFISVQTEPQHQFSPMDSRKSTSQQGRRPPPSSPPPLCPSSDSLGDDDSQDDAGVAVRPRRLRPHRPHATTPRTKRRSYAQLSELVRRQKEQRRVPSDTDLVDHIMEGKRHRHGDPSEENTAAEAKHQPHPQQRLIQVAVRCRPRESSQRRDHSDDDDEEEEIQYDNDPSDDDLPHRIQPSDDDCVVEYEIPTTSSSTTTTTTLTTPLPVVSVPSHVLALGGHGPRRRFAFDYVFPPGNAQRDVYDACARDAIDGVLRTATGTEHEKEAHATIVAYGQTGTGKTYTMGMLQHADPHTEERDHGIIPRAILHILSRIADVNRTTQGVRLEASVSFLQIYLESIQDLLTPTAPATSGSGPGRQPAGLQVRLDPAVNVFHVPGLSEFPINHIDDARALLERAAHYRVLAATARNKTSSRSHTLLTISIRQQLQHQQQSDGSELDGDLRNSSSGSSSAATPRSTVSFVDLAGSERVEGALHFLHATRRRQELRIREAKFINRSLSALGSVIAALATQEDTNTIKNGHTKSQTRQRHHQQTPAPHIRFRDSQLTKLLQSRLMHGNGRLVLIATIDDRAANLTETLSTLKFASQCRRVDLRRRGSAAQSDALRRRQRQEEQLQQAVAAVTTEYKQREAALQQTYETRLAALNEQLERVTKNKASNQHSAAPYVALCSLADIAQQQQQQHGHEATATSAVPRHPLVESFQDEREVVAYTATLYGQVRTALLCGGSVPHRTRTVTTECSAPSVTKKASPVKPTTITSSDKPSFRSTANEAEFRAIARWLFASGALQTLDVSSDEDDEVTFSQLS